MKTLERDIASAVILSSDYKILLGQKDPASGGVYADGSWLLPGGGVEPGETPIEALHREIMEETGLDTSMLEAELVDDQITHSSPKTFPNGEQIIVQMKFFVFRIRINEEAAAIPIRPSHELPTLQWIEVSSLSKYKQPPPSAPLFKKLGMLK